MTTILAFANSVLENRYFQADPIRYVRQMNRERGPEEMLQIPMDPVLRCLNHFLGIRR